MKNLPAKKSEVERRKPDLRPPWCERCNRPVQYFQVTPYYHPRVHLWCDSWPPPIDDRFDVEYHYEVACHGETIRGVVMPDGTLRATSHIMMFGGGGPFR